MNHVLTTCYILVITDKRVLRNCRLDRPTFLTGNCVYHANIKIFTDSKSDPKKGDRGGGLDVIRNIACTFNTIIVSKISILHFYQGRIY